MLAIILLLAIFLCNPSGVWALNSATSSANLTPREVFKQKLQIIKDEKKKALAGQLEERLNNLNANTTRVLTTQLGNLENFLDRIEERVKLRQGQNKPVGDALTQIAAVRTNISVLQTKLVAQKEKQYAPTITTESALRPQFQETRTNLQKDLLVLRMELVKIRLDIIDIVKNLLGSTSANPQIPATTSGGLSQ